MVRHLNQFIFLILCGAGYQASYLIEADAKLPLDVRHLHLSYLLRGSMSQPELVVLPNSRTETNLKYVTI